MLNIRFKKTVDEENKSIKMTSRASEGDALFLLRYGSIYCYRESNPDLRFRRALFLSIEL